MELSILLSLLISFMACITDLKYRKIPNWLTVPAIALALLLKLPCTSLPSLLITLFSCSIVILLWEMNLMGGGDAKLLMAIFILIGEYVISFFILLALVIFFQFIIFGVIESIRRRKNILPHLLLIALSSMTSYMVSRNMLATMLSTFVMGDLLTPFMPYWKKMRVGEAVGEVLAETIKMEDGKIKRMRQKPSLIYRFLETFEEKGEILGRAFKVIESKDVEKIGKYCDYVEVFISYPMAPLIFIALLLLIPFKNIYQVFIPFL